MEINVKLNKTVLSIDANGYGGTTISTANPYTVLESSIYKVVIDTYVKVMPKKVRRVANVAPFGACFSSKNIGSTRLGPDVPSIDLVLQSKSVYWRIVGANSMVKVNSDILCLGFVKHQLIIINGQEFRLLLEGIILKIIFYNLTFQHQG